MNPRGEYGIHLTGQEGQLPHSPIPMYLMYTTTMHDLRCMDVNTT